MKSWIKTCLTKLVKQGAVCILHSDHLVCVDYMYISSIDIINYYTVYLMQQRAEKSPVKFCSIDTHTHMWHKC